MDVGQVRVDLLAEQQELDDIVSGLAERDWTAPTPSPRWTVAHQIAHLAYFDRSAGLAITDPEGFPALVSEFSIYIFIILKSASSLTNLNTLKTKVG